MRRGRLLNYISRSREAETVVRSRQHVPLDNTTRGNEAQNNGAQERNDVDGDYQNDLEVR